MCAGLDTLLVKHINIINDFKTKVAAGRCEDTQTKDQNSNYRQITSCFVFRRNAERTVNLKGVNIFTRTAVCICLDVITWCSVLVSSLNH